MRRWSVAICLLAICLLALAGCVHASAPQTPTAPTSGVRGSIVHVGGCSAAQAGTPCPARPWNGFVQAWTLGGQEVASVHTKPPGRFRLPLAPGAYILIPATAEGPLAGRHAVTVTAGAFVTVELRVAA